VTLPPHERPRPRAIANFNSCGSGHVLRRATEFPRPEAG